jgi:RNA polymerase sigma factor (sigma-70 family)
MSAAKSPSPPPFQVFLEQHGPSVLAFCRAMAGPEDAEDCFQDTLLAALRAYERMDGRNPRAWVLTIARRKAIDLHRARARRPEPRAEPPEQPAYDSVDHGDPELWAAVADLPPKQRAAVALRFAADLAYREVADALGSSEEAARRSVHEGLKRLRKRIEVEGGKR